MLSVALPDLFVYLCCLLFCFLLYVNVLYMCVQMSIMDNFIITTVKQFKFCNCQCQDLGQMYMDCQWEDLGQVYIWTVRYRNWLFAHSNYIIYVKHGCIISFKLSPNNLPLTEPQIILLLLKLKVNKKKSLTRAEPLSRQFSISDHQCSAPEENKTAISGWY